MRIDTSAGVEIDVVRYEASNAVAALFADYWKYK